MSYIKAEYEVYRYGKWWENNFTIQEPKAFPYFVDFWTQWIFPTEDAGVIRLLKEMAYKRDLWEIRNLTYKYYDKEKNK